MAGIHQRNHQQQQVHQVEQQQQRFIVENASTSSSPFFPTHPNYQHFPQQQQHQHQHLVQHQIQHLPFTQQFFQYQHHPQYYYRSILDHQQQQEIRILEPRPEGDNNEVQVSPFFPLNFKLGMENNVEEDALVRGSERYCTEPRQTSLVVSHCCQNQEDSAIKLPFWKPLYAEFSNGNNNNNNSSESKNKLHEVDQEMYSTEEMHQQQQHIIKSLEDSNKSRLVFGELEAIYATKANADATTNINRIASESVLTAEDLPMNNNNNVTFPLSTFNDSSNQATGAATAGNVIDIGSESASVGGREVEAEAEAEGSKEEVHERKRKKKSKEGRVTSNSMARFFESLVKKLVNHQENLQKRFMETIERLDQERKEREEAWREQELSKVQKEAAARAHERTLALNRESVLVSYLEKITGQKINFHEDKSCTSTLEKANNKRWHQAEVDALVQIRTCFESKFQEAGKKGVLWEEISKSMASMGFERNARRCKEKWENMHKCSVKKTKELTREQLNDGNDSTHQENGENRNGCEREDMEEVKETGDKKNIDE